MEMGVSDLHTTESEIKMRGSDKHLHTTKSEMEMGVSDLK
jgi:hypothetical protein